MTTTAHEPTRSAPGVDAITTEVVRNALRSGAGQMRQVLMRSAFSQLIYEVLDFACGLYDRKVQMLAQAESLAMFLGTLDACIIAAVKAVGGEEALEEGDILLYNVPYGTGSHPQDAALIMPAFVNGELVGYAAVKAHWPDIGGKDVYSADTNDIQQEGTLYPGVKLYKAGERNEDIWAMILANSRAPRQVSGDVSAKIGAVRIGVRALAAVVERHGTEGFEAAVEHGFAESERWTRSFIERIPDGVYKTDCVLHGDGLSDDEIRYEIPIEIKGSDVIIDLTDTPDQCRGPINSPLPGTISGARVALAALTAAGDRSDEGCFRPLQVITRPGSIYEPVNPAPSFIFWTAQIELIEAMFRALAPAIPDHVPADSGADVVATVWWGAQRTPYQRRQHDAQEPWIDGAPAPIGQGAWKAADGQNALMHVSESCTRISPVEVWEAKNPWLVEQSQLAQDSCGPGRTRGGLGINCHIRILEDCYVTTTLEQTTHPPQGLFGGGTGRCNSVTVVRADGSVTKHVKESAVFVERDAVVCIDTGGGGGYGPPEERDPEAVRKDLAEGYISTAHAERHYAAQAATTDDKEEDQL
jgi:N-methylhydantoinase B